MPTVTTLTFTIGADASRGAARQIAQTQQCLRAQPQAWLAQADDLARCLDQLLADSPEGFDLRLREGPYAGMRLIWDGVEDDCGILHIVQRDELRSINLLLGPAQAPRSGVLTIQRLAELMGSIDGYRRGLNMVCGIAGPLIATFCCASGSLDLPIETAVFAFAAVLFSRQDARAETRGRGQSQSAAGSSYRARES